MTDLQKYKKNDKNKEKLQFLEFVAGKRTEIVRNPNFFSGFRDRGGQFDFGFSGRLVIS